jgi:hypothetical protein
MSYLNPEKKLVDISTFDKLPEVVKYYKKLKAQGIKISNHSQVKSSLNLQAIVENIPNALELHLEGIFFDEKGGDLEVLKGFKNLRCLVVMSQKENDYPFIDFSWFPNLEMLFIDSFKNTVNFEKSNVTSLNYLHNGTDLTDFTPPHTMTSLSVTGKIKSLAGIEKIQQLKKIRFRMLTNVKETHHLDMLSNLQCLELKHCTKIDYNNFTSNFNIKYLFLELLETKVKLPSIQFLSKLPNIEGVVIQADIADGDISPLLNMPKLKKCWFQNKKNYSHSFEGICSLKNIDMLYWNCDKL